VGINVRIVNPVDDDAEEEVPALPFVLRLVVEIGFGTGPRTDTGADNDDTAPDEDPDAIDDGPVVLVTMAADAAAYVIGAGTLAVLVATLRFLYLMGAGAAATGGRAAVPLAPVLTFRFVILVVPEDFVFGGLLSVWVGSGFFFFFFFFTGVRRTWSSWCGGGDGAGDGAGPCRR